MHVKGKHVNQTTEGLLQADLVLETIKTLTKRNRDLEARLEALEDAHVRLLDGLKDWAQDTKDFMQRGDFQYNDVEMWLIWYNKRMTNMKDEWEQQSRRIYSQSCGFGVRD
jgi:hypothetical protein